MEGFLDPRRPVERRRGRCLPHWSQEGTLHFVTFRLADSLPAPVVRRWATHRDGWLQTHRVDPADPAWREAFAALGAAERADFHRRFTEGLLDLLDEGHGGCALRPREAEAVVHEAMAFFDGERYDLDERVVAGNHAHAVLVPREGFEVSGIVTGWKRITAKRIHALNGTRGRFWQAETYDHLIRSPRRLEGIRAYLRAHRP